MNENNDNKILSLLTNKFNTCISLHFYSSCAFACHFLLIVDVHVYIEMPVSERPLELEKLLKDCPNTVGRAKFIENVCVRLQNINLHEA